jgi:hypothetical protein
MIKTSSLLQKYGAWAVVTGASDGIGREFARRLAKSGFHVALVARRRSVLEELGKELEKKYGVQTKPVAADLAQNDGVALALKEAEALDVGLFVAAAGFGASGDFVNSMLSEEIAMIDVNCRAVAEHTHHFANRFKARGRGGIILLSSLVAFQGAPKSAGYAATKAFIQTFAEGLRVELQPHGVDVLSVAPGPIESGFGARADMKMNITQKPDVVAREALAALGRRTTVRPGWLSKFLGYSLSAAPRFMRVKIMSAIMDGMTKHQKSQMTGLRP